MPNAQGIDVYEGTGVVDWLQVARSGRVFAWLKAAEGVTIRDSRYKVNYDGAHAVGIMRGAYIYAHPDDSPHETVNNLLAATANTKPELGYALDLEVTGGLTAGALQIWVNQFATALAKATGTKPLDYSYPAFISKTRVRFGLSRGTWIADYGVSKPPDGWTFWQYSSKGTVPGVSGPCDLDEFNGNLAAMKEWAGVMETVKILINGKEFPTDGVMDGGNTMVPWTALREFGADVKAAAVDAKKYGTDYAFDFTGTSAKATNEKPVSVTLTYADGKTDTAKL